MSDTYGSDFVTISDEDGKEYVLEHLDTIEYEGSMYMAFLPAEMDIEDSYDLIILKVEPEEGTGDEILVTIEDETELHEVFDIFSARLEDMFEDTEE